MPQTNQKPFRHAHGTLAGIQYAGEPGSTSECLNAILRLIQCRAGVSRARILSNGNNHGILLTVRPGHLVAVRCGFTSGYRGEGPRGFSKVLAVLQRHGTDIEELDVDSDVIDHLNHSALTSRDLDRIDAAHPVRPPRLPNYIEEQHWHNVARIWQDTDPFVPLSIIDERLFDLALDLPPRFSPLAQLV